VNLVLLDADEVAADGTCRLVDRRARHLREVLGVALGAKVRAGIVGGSLGSAEVVANDADTVVVRFASDAAHVAPVPLAIDIVVAMPRPKAVARVVETCAAFGVRTIALTNAWRVDKSYLKSPKLAPEALALAARIGAEQGATTHVPPVSLHARLMALLDERFSGDAVARELRLVAHPHAPPLEHAAPRLAAGAPLAIAFGPEGGWIQRELDTLVTRGFQPVSLGAPILRVESAVAAALGQLLLLQRLAATP
jgi:16S rRNA (uracil1498-N3)-methyltransferase